MMRKIIASSLIATITWSTGILAAPLSQQGVAVEGPTFEDAMARLDRFIDMIDELRSHVDRSQFDLEALLEKLDYDADEIVRFVAEEIYFEQYSGLLRGPAGALMSRAGNALDQSVLLARLLGDAGYDRRIVHGSLAGEDARVLVQGMRDPRLPAGAPLDIEATDRTLDEWRRTSGLGSAVTGFLDLETPEDWISRISDSLSRAEMIARELEGILVAADLPLAAPTEPADLLEAARDYYWVEYRLGTSEPWRAAHPAFGRRTPQSPERREVIRDSIPEDLQHRLRFEVEIEQKLGDKLKRKNVMEAWERPVANLIGVQLTYMNLPSGLTDPLSQDPWDVSSATEVFLPMFGRQLAPGALAFDLDGVTVPPDALAVGAAGVFRQAGKKTERAAATISGLGRSGSDADTDVRELTGQWLVYTLISPGGESRTIRRRLFSVEDLSPVPSVPDRSSEEVRQFAATWSLAGVHTLMVSTGEYPDAFLYDRKLQQIAGMREILTQSLRARFGMEIDGSEGKETPAPETGVEFPLFSMISAGPPDQENRIAYTETPTVVGTWQKIAPHPSGLRLQKGVDIVSLGQRVLDTSEGTVRTAASETMLAGVWATEAEQLMLRALTEGMEPLGAPQSFLADRESDVPMRVIRPGEEAKLAAMPLSAAMMASIEENLSAGYAAVVPARIEPGEWGGWWRVDASTGETLGMGPDGRGVTLAEHVILISTILFLVVPVFTSLSVATVCAAAGCGRRICMRAAANAYIVSVLIAGAVWGLTVSLAFGAGTPVAVMEPTALASGRIIGQSNHYLRISETAHKIAEALDVAGVALDFFIEGNSAAHTVAECGG